MNKKDLLVGILGCTLALTACSSNKKTDAKELPKITTADAVKEYGNRKMSDSTHTSPITKYLQGENGSDPAALRAQQQKSENTIQVCMNKKGFTYNIQISDVTDPATTWGQDLTNKEYMEQWGYGVTTMTDDSGAPIDGSPLSTVSTELPDPNSAMLAAMSPEEQDAWNTALYGSMGVSETASSEEDYVDGETPTDANTETLTESTSGQDTGCIGEAYQNAGSAKYEEKLGELFAEFGKQFTADDRYKAASTTYLRCVADAGYDEIKTVPWSQFATEQKGDSDTTPTGIISEKMSQNSPQNTENISPGTISPQLAAIQEEERAMAKAEFPCLAVFTLQIENIQDELETTFLDENRAFFTDYKKATESDS